MVNSCFFMHPANTLLSMGWLTTWFGHGLPSYGLYLTAEAQALLRLGFFSARGFTLAVTYLLADSLHQVASNN